MQNDIPPLCPGDHLLYYDGSLVDRIICVKTWSDVGHIEIYAGDGMSIASRATGVNAYPLRIPGLRYVRRPKCLPNFVTGKSYFDSVRGDKYDYAGLFCFTLAVKQGSVGKQFCSEFATNWDRASGLMPFDTDWPADKVSPGQFLQTPILKTVWKYN